MIDHKCSTDTLADIDTFMKTYSQTRNYRNFSNLEEMKKLLTLRRHLVEEEYNELYVAIEKYLSVLEIKNEYEKSIFPIALKPSHEKFDKYLNNLLIDAMTEIYDAALDIKYVVEGLFITFGLPMEKGFNEVQRSNMSKLGRDGKPIYNNEGKVMKGEDYSPPNLKQFIKAIFDEIEGGDA
jgi:predicted HAD superfamily Cof-like phosphohydrolase